MTYHERNERIFESHNAGVPLGVIAAQEGMRRDAVLGLIGRHRQNGRPIARQRRERKRAWGVIESRWREGASIKEIASELGASPANVGVMMMKMRRRGVDLPYRNRPQT